MNISDNGLEMLKTFEGCKLESYRDSGGVWTIGVGHTSSHLHGGMRITQGEADDLLKHDVHWAEKAVNHLVRVPITQNQFDALVSFTFNLGSGALARSSLLQKINAKDFAGAADEFPHWCHVGKRVIHGLVVRREKERDVFLGLA